VPESLLFSDAAGNDERMTYLYDSCKVRQLEEVGEIAIPPSDLAGVRLPGSDQRFEGFDRNPYLGLFAAGSFTAQLANVHLYFGTSSTESMNRRKLETLAVAEWAERRRKSPFCSTPNILPPPRLQPPEARAGRSDLRRTHEPRPAPCRPRRSPAFARGHGQRRS
jgi:hypothetical protein